MTAGVKLSSTRHPRESSTPLCYQHGETRTIPSFATGETTGTVPTQRRSPPLPLENPWQYLRLIRQMYLSSTAMILGNMLEWLDFGIYGYSELEISQVIFDNNVTAGWATFGLGYAFRPIGALVLGRLADSTSSRHLSFVIAIVGMAGSTALLALLPAICPKDNSDNADHNDSRSFWWNTYCVTELWKVAGPAIVLRCIQGFSAGAAAGGVNVIQSETWSQKLPHALAQSVGVNNVSGAAASILSAGIVFGLRAWMGKEDYAAWGWRLAFCIVIPPSAMAACLLTTHNETAGRSDPTILPPKTYHEYELAEQNYAEREDQGEIVGATNGGTFVLEVFEDEPATVQVQDEDGATLANETQQVGLDTNTDSQISTWLLITLSIYIQFAIASYNNLNIYMVQYAKDNYDVSSETAMLMALTGKTIQLIMTPFAAGAADVYGWFAVCGASGIGCAFLAVPLMAASTMAGSTTMVWFLVAGILPGISTFWILNAPLLATSIFPAHRRSEGTSLVMAMGTALAGFFPLLLNQIEHYLAGDDGISSTRASYSCGAVLAVIAVLAATAILWIRRWALQGKIPIYQRPYLF